jgi:hypothetical protein
MRSLSPLITLIVGLLVGVVLVLSCSDNSPGRVDAATCTCEPPISDRIMIVNATQVIPANGRSGQGTGCPAGATMLSGSCTTETINPNRDVTLEQSGFYGGGDENGWECEFKNNEATPVTIKVSVRCLMPAP